MERISPLTTKAGGHSVVACRNGGNEKPIGRTLIEKGK